MSKEAICEKVKDLCKNEKTIFYLSSRGNLVGAFQEMNTSEK